MSPSPLKSGHHADEEPLMPRTIISTPDAPKAIGPYSQAVAAGDTVYLSGEVPFDPASGQPSARHSTTRCASPST